MDQLSEKRQAIFDLLSEADKALRPKEIAEKLDNPADSTRHLVRAMAKEGLLVRVRKGGYYTIAARKHEFAVNEREDKVNAGEGVSEFPVVEYSSSASPSTEEPPIRLPDSFLMRWIGRIPEKAYWTFVHGENMEPWLPDGSPVLVEVCSEVAGGGRYILFLDDQRNQMVKRIERLGGDVFLLISDNPAHSTREVKHVEGDTYQDVASDHQMHIHVQGRIVYPPDTPQAILRTFAQQMAEVLRQR